MKTYIKFLHISFFFGASVHAMQGNKKPDPRLLETTKYADKKQSINLIAQTRHVTHQAQLGGQLVKAAKKGHHEKLQQLISAGAPINHLTRKGNSALYFAILGGHHECLRTLLDAGASQTHINLQSVTLSIGGSPESIRILADYATDSNKNTALLLAIRAARSACVQVLIKAGVNVDYYAEDGLTALMLSTYLCNQTIARLLINAGANIDYTNSLGKTALTCAGNRNYLPICVLLVKAMLIPKKQKDAVVAFIGSRKKGLLNEWNVPRDIVRLIGKYIFAASKHANTPKAIEEIEKIKSYEMKQQLFKCIPNAIEEIKKIKDAQNAAIKKIQDAQNKDRIFNIINECEY
jgi:ankyrin repeat protein